MAKSMAKSMAKDMAKKMAKNMVMTTARSQSSPVYVEQRNGPQDRRSNTDERRNSDRANDDFLPRRNPDLIDRRS